MTLLGLNAVLFFVFFFCRAEVTALLRLSEPGHPNIIKLYTVLEDADNMYMILEYASHGELFDYIVENSPLGTCFFSLIMRCLAAPLVFFFFFLAFSFFFFFFFALRVSDCV
jgi:serine/threonine protein kinase